MCYVQAFLKRQDYYYTVVSERKKKTTNSLHLIENYNINDKN